MVCHDFITGSLKKKKKGNEKAHWLINAHCVQPNSLNQSASSGGTHNIMEEIKKKKRKRRRRRKKKEKSRSKVIGLLVTLIGWLCSVTLMNILIPEPRPVKSATATLFLLTWIENDAFSVALKFPNKYLPLVEISSPSFLPSKLSPRLNFPRWNRLGLRRLKMHWFLFSFIFKHLNFLLIF